MTAQVDMELYFYSTAGLDVACPPSPSPHPTGWAAWACAGLTLSDPSSTALCPYGDEHGGRPGRRKWPLFSGQMQGHRTAPHRTALHCTAAQRSVACSLDGSQMPD